MFTSLSDPHPASQGKDYIVLPILWMRPGEVRQCPALTQQVGSRAGPGLSQSWGSLSVAPASREQRGGRLPIKATSARHPAVRPQEEGTLPQSGGPAPTKAAHFPPCCGTFRSILIVSCVHVQLDLARAAPTPPTHSHGLLLPSCPVSGRPSPSHFPWGPGCGPPWLTGWGLFHLHVPGLGEGSGEGGAQCCFPNPMPTHSLQPTEAPCPAEGGPHPCPTAENTEAQSRQSCDSNPGLGRPTGATAGVEWAGQEEDC